LCWPAGATDAEDGGLAGESLSWAVDGANVGNSAEAIAAGLAPGAHTGGADARRIPPTTAPNAGVSFNVAPLAIALVSEPLLDGMCDDSSYGDGAQVQLAPYGVDGQATVRLARSSGAHLWACFTGMQKGAATPGAFAGLRVDVDNSRSALAQAGDIGFFAGEDGDVFTLVGDGAGGFATAGPGGLQAQISSQATTWSAELRIDAARLGGWEQLVGLTAGHYWRNFQGDDFLWPYSSTLWNKPNTWATTALGDQPVLTSIDPYTASVGGAGLHAQHRRQRFLSAERRRCGGGASAGHQRD
jgi:hypothetical protein